MIIFKFNSENTNTNYFFMFRNKNSITFYSFNKDSTTNQYRDENFLKKAIWKM